MMTTATCMLGLYAETSIHAGTGATTGVIDLPIMREAHTGWPCVYASAFKGALRDRAEECDPGGVWVPEVFGPLTNNASDHAGALLVGDARLLLLPVRSLTSHFKYVTCPALLKRYRADRQRLGLDWPDAAVIPDVAGFDVIVSGKPTEDLFLEEFRFSQKPVDLSKLIVLLAQMMGCEEPSKALEQQLAIVGNDAFSHLCRHATPVAAHVRLDEKKTVERGALWYEETLPPDTVLYACLLAQKTRKEDGALNTAAQVMEKVRTELFPPTRPYLQLGGNETLGMGWCKVSVVPPPEVKS